MKNLRVLRRLLAAAVLLFASAQSHAGFGFCAPDAPSVASTQTSSGGLFTIDIAASAGGCPYGASILDGELSILMVPYFTDAHASISAPAGWTWQIVADDLLHVGHGAGALVFSASTADARVGRRATLSGFLISSAFSGVYASAYQASTVGLIPMDYYFRMNGLGIDLMPLIPGSPDAIAAMALPTAPVPEPASWALLALGLAAVWAVAKRETGRQDASIPT